VRQLFYGTCHADKDGPWKSNCTAEDMAKPDMPNFSIAGRIVFGVIAVVVIIAMLHFFGVF